MMLLTSACDSSMQPLTHATVEADASLASVPANRSWLGGSDPSLVLQRGLLNGSEQVMSLPNATAVPGDNVMVMRSRTDLGISGRFQFEEFMRRVNGPPQPFTDLHAGDLVSVEDELGTYLWTDRRFGTDTICVFAVRRLDGRTSQLPGNIRALDIMLRNCVVGTVDDALRPIRAESIRASGGGSRANTRMISPLAGPTL